LTIYTETALGSDAYTLWRRCLNPTAMSPEDGPRIAVLLIGDGRDGCRAATMDSFAKRVSGYRLRGVVQVDDRAHQLGFAGAIEAGWSALRDRMLSAERQGYPPPWDYVFHLEEDWAFLRPVDVRAMASVLDADPTLVQCALRREPVNDAERVAGGVVEAWPREYEERIALTPTGGVPYLRHSLFFTTNPSLYRRELVEAEAWPQVPRSEDEFGRYLVRRGQRFAFLGERTEPVYLRHTGERRGTGY
jgi:hypothetical protein